jgi:hypothetical protein
MNTDTLTILELKQSKSGVVVNNGDYEVKLTAPVAIEQGDQIAIKNVFIDTTSNTANSIAITNDTIMTFNANIYAVNWKASDKTYYKGVAPPLNIVDGLKYIMVDKTTIPAQPIEAGFEFAVVNYIQVASLIPYVPPIEGQPPIISAWGAGYYQIEYTDEGGTAQIHNFYIPPLSNDKAATYNAQLDIIIKRKIERPTNDYGYIIRESQTLTPSFGSVHNYKNDSVVETTTPTIKYVPSVVSTSVTIPKGYYTPARFAEIVNDSINSPTADVSEEFTPTDKPFLFSSWSGRYNNRLFMLAERDPALPEYSSGATFAYQYTQNPEGTPPVTTDTYPVWIGTNQFSLQYDPTKDTFYFDYLNMPYYTTNGKQAILQYNIYATTDPAQLPKTSSWINNRIKVISSNGGIALTNVTSIDQVTKQEVNLWERIGFTDDNYITPTFKVSAIGDETSFTPIMNWQLGQNITQGLIGVDSYVQKAVPAPTAQTLTSFYRVPQINQTQGVLPPLSEVEINQVNIINGGKVFLQVEGGGYFQVSVQTQFKHLLIGEETIRRDITALVSRYYSNGNFTTAGQESAINYIHESAIPLYLSSFKVRILDGDGILSPDIGSDNSVYLQIIKAPKQEVKK